MDRNSSKANKHRENNLKCSIYQSEFNTKINLNRHMCDPELHKNLQELFIIISSNHEYFGKSSTNEAEKQASAANAASCFYQKMSFSFPNV